MTTHVNASGRPTLAPLWTSQQGLGKRSMTTFRAAEGPLLSPSPVSAASVPSPVYPNFDKLMRKKDRALLDSLSHKVSPLSATSPKSAIEGQSPLVSKLEQASIKFISAEQSQSPNSPQAARGSLRKLKENRECRPHEDYGNITADVFVIARSIRRNTSPAGENSRPFWEGGLPKTKVPQRLTLRAIIRPKAPGRKTFLIQRNLDIDELRVAASENSSKCSANCVAIQSKSQTPASPGEVGVSPSQAERPSPQIMSHSTDYDKLIYDPKTVPLHLHYTISTLPALAVSLTSGHVRSGDVIYLPVPHAESWPQTIHYVYTGQGELTIAIRENIIYLGGRV
ncbi:hypothetical protein GGR55DRAFT_678845 [Xylaria sp. FL0064]|nr:hypothetical protein GGR55DRAFT_678845 [Xylaria sp. FL0064]